MSNITLSEWEIAMREDLLLKALSGSENKYTHRCVDEVEA